MFRWNIFLQRGDNEMSFLGTVHADTQGQALKLAAQFWEIPIYDLIAIQLHEIT